jgi:hypothetical protein
VADASGRKLSESASANNRLILKELGRKIGLADAADANPLGYSNWRFKKRSRP